MNARGSRAAQVLLGLIAGGAGVALAVRGVDWERFAGVIRQAQPLPLLAAAVLSAAVVVAGGVRWRLAARPQAELSRADAIEIVMICTFLNVLLARLGDLARAALTAETARVHAGRVLGGVVVERFVDVLMVLILAAAMSVLVGFPSAVRAGVLLFALVALAALAAIWLAAAWFSSVVRTVLSVVSTKAGAVAAGVIDALAEGVRTSARNGQLLRVVAWSIVIWALSGTVLVLTMKALHVPVPWVAGFFVLLVINLGGAIPASPGAIGVYHYLFVLALSVWLSDPSIALGAAVVSHALGIIVTLLLGVSGLARRGISVGRLSSMFSPAALSTK